jgi:biopolymer transport protein ExbD
MARPPKAFDVWFVAADTVYRGVPYNVVADWAQEGRLAPTDMVRPAGKEVPWTKVGEHEYLSDYVPRPVAARVVNVEPLPEPEPASEPVPVAAVVAPPAGESAVGEHAGLDDHEPPPRRSRGEEDDEVDMIPLIDVSMVLLVFFIIMRAAAALAPVDVPEMKFAGELQADPTALTVIIEKKDADNIYYAVRVGTSPPRPEHDKLDTREQMVKAVTELAAEAPHPPEVRIACRKELPRERVYEVRRDLQPLKKADKINSFTATVLEAPKK